MNDYGEPTTALDEVMIERMLKTWDDFESYVKDRRQARHEAIDTYLERKRNGTGSPTPEPGDDTSTP